MSLDLGSVIKDEGTSVRIDLDHTFGRHHLGRKARLRGVQCEGLQSGMKLLSVEHVPWLSRISKGLDTVNGPQTHVWVLCLGELLFLQQLPMGGEMVRLGRAVIS